MELCHFFARGWTRDAELDIKPRSADGYVDGRRKLRPGSCFVVRGYTRADRS